MFRLDTWEEIYTSIKQHKLRAGLTAFGVSWGIFMLVILLGSGQALQNGVEYQFRDDAVNTFWVSPRRVSKPYQGLPVGRRLRFTNDDHTLTKERVEGVEHITSRFYISGEFSTSYKDESASFPVRCVHPAHKIIENTIMTSGRYINELDLKDKRKVAVIGKLVKEQLFKEKDPLGKYITIKGVDYKVVGTFEDLGSEGEMEMIYLPIYTAQLAHNGQGRIGQFMFTVGNATVEESQKIEENLRRELATRHKFDIEDKKAVRINNGVENFQRFMNLFFYIRVFVWFVGSGTLLAGIIGVSNIMLIIVKERTKEIGIRKALGATSWSIVSLILQEAIVLTGFAGYIGFLSGVGLLTLIRWAIDTYDIETGFFRSPSVDFSVAITSVVILTLFGALAGLVPALKAAKVNPIVAMRDE